MGRHSQMSTLGHEIPSVEALISAYGHRLPSRNLLQHHQRRIALCPPVGHEHFCGDDQSVAILDQQIPAVAQLGLLPITFARQLRLGIGLRCMRLIRPPLAAKVHRGIAGIVRRRRRLSRSTARCWKPGRVSRAFSRNRLLEADVAKQFLAQVVEQARAQGLTSNEHFTVDGTLLEAWASLKSFQPKQGKSAPPPDDPGNPTVNFRGERRSNETHASKTDAEAQLARKSDGKESKLSYSGNLLVENRNGLIVAAEVFVANGRAERDAALVMLEQIPGRKPVTVGGDKGFDTRDFVAECRHLGVTPHVAQNLARRGGSAIDGRTTQHSSYGLSQK